MSADSPRRSQVSTHRNCILSMTAGNSSGAISVPATVPPQVVSDRSIIDSAIGFINDVTLAAHQPHTDPKDTISWARFESAADISDPRFGEDWELEGNVAPPLLLILGYGMGVQVWAIPANGEAVEVLSWRHGIVTTLRVLPTPIECVNDELHERADETMDTFAGKRPLIALVDGNPAGGVGTSGGSSAQTQFSAVNFVSLKTGMQVKAIKFKNPVVDILANRNSVVITFNERIAVFDARTLEDRLSITTCYPSPGINPNPIALGPRWLAYAEHKLLHTKRSGGGCDGDGVASYTATVLNAAKSFGKGLRELGEQVAAGLTGSTTSGSNSKNSSFDSATGSDAKQPGVVTILDVKHAIKDYSPTSGAPISCHAGSDPIVAHFIAHSDALVAMEFDNSGMLLLTADRRGHDFHVFRIQPHSVGSSLSAVHHLYTLHRGDTSSKVQNIAFSLDSRWVAVSTLRGTTHVFPITPYGGPMGVRTHTSLHVVNKLSRFHRSAGLTADGRSSSPISYSDNSIFTQSLQPYHNPTLPPFPRPTVVQPLAQLRQPFALSSPPGSAGLVGVGVGVGKSVVGVGSGSSSSQRQRLSSLSDDSGKPLSVCAIFAKSRSWLLDPPNATREAPHRIQRKSVDSLFVMAGHGALIQYDLDTKLASNVAKEKFCDDTPIELEVEAKAQWNLGRRREGAQEVMPPLSLDNWLIKSRNSCTLTDSTRQFEDVDDRTDSWLAQVEIVTHAGPHRRLWMGPQFIFKTYNTPSGSNLNHVDAEAVEIGVSKTSSANTSRAERSSPLNMPISAAGRSSVPVLIESGSYSSIEQSPKLMDRFPHDHLDSDFAVAHGDSRLKEDLADAMRESPSVSTTHKDIGRCLALLPTTSDAALTSDNAPFYDALGEHDDYDQNFDHLHRPSASTVAALASALPNIYASYETSAQQPPSIEKYVNPLGTVTTITSAMTTEIKTDILDEVVSQLASEESVIHENCDESLFRPVVAIYCDEKARKRAADAEEERIKSDLCKPPELIGNKLIVPVIAKELDDEMSKREKAKLNRKTQFIDVEQSTEKSLNLKASNSSQKEAKNCEKRVNLKPQNCEKENNDEETVINFKRMTPVPTEKTEKPIKPVIATRNVGIKETANKTKYSAKEETAVPKDKPTHSAIKKELERGAKKQLVQTENLNISDLADSLIEDDAPAALAQKNYDETTVITLLETVNIYANAENNTMKSEENVKLIENNKIAEAEIERKKEDDEIKMKSRKNNRKTDDKIEIVKSNSAETKIMETPKENKINQMKDENADQTKLKDAGLNEVVKQEKNKESVNVEKKEKIMAKDEKSKQAVKYDKTIEKANEKQVLINVENQTQALKSQIKNTEDRKESLKTVEKRKEETKQQNNPYDDDEEIKEVKVEKKDVRTEKIEEKEFKVKIVETKNERKETENNSNEIIQNETKINNEYQVKVIDIEEKIEKETKAKSTKKQNLQKGNGKDVITQQPLKNKNSIQMTSTVTAKLPDVTSAWKTLSGAEMINKTLEKTAEVADIPIKTNKKIKKTLSNDLTDFPMLKPLEALPPLPALEPLELLSTGYEELKKECPLSLINFESPSQENVGLTRKINPAPRGFSEQNLIYALCGSLHYENETSDKTDTVYSPTLSLTRSSSVLGEQSTAEYKSLTENDEQYVSLELSSQDTNTTNTHTTTNEKLTSSSSNTSSASEEIVTLEEKKMSKRQKRKLQKIKKETNVTTAAAQEEVDEELRPLIENTSNGLSDSQADSAGEQFIVAAHTSLPNSRYAASNNTTTDSEGPMPATTSDDNAIYTFPSGMSSPTNATHKIKTKKLEHKINLIAAIEAATSSSTSSAEESGVEANEERRVSQEMDGSALVNLANSINTAPLLTLPAISVATAVPTSSAATNVISSAVNGGTKKKTKRRKR